MDIVSFSIFRRFIIDAIKKLANDNEFEVSKTFIIINYNKETDEIILRLYHFTEHIRDVEFEEIFKPGDILDIGLDHMSIDDIKQKLKRIIEKNVNLHSLDLSKTMHLLCYNGDLRIFIYVDNKCHKEIEITDLII
jgi:hypothetical protein